MTLPRVQPIIPTWRKEPFDDPEWLFDFKYDGFRGLCADSERSRPRIRDDVAHQSDLMSLGVPR
jgi:hypothetical protein